MNQNTSYQNELHLGATLAAFHRDSISAGFQLHWHFAGKCEALLLGKTIPVEHACEKLSEVSRLIDEHYNSEDWKQWNHAHGSFDGLAEVIAQAQVVVAGDLADAFPSAKLQNEMADLRTGERRREVLERYCLAFRLRSAFPDTRPLYWYFHGKMEALRNAEKPGRTVLCAKFEEARYASHEKGLDWKKRHYECGVASGYAEAAALSKSASKSRSKLRA